MKRSLGLAVLLCCTSTAMAADRLPLLVRGLKRPLAVAVGPDGKAYASVLGDQAGDGKAAVLVIQDAKAVPFATGFDAPRSLVFFQGWLFVADMDRIWRIDGKGKAEVFVSAKSFPIPVKHLWGLTVDEQGTLYAGQDDQMGTIFRIDPKGKVTLVTDQKRAPELVCTGALAMDGMSHLLVGGSSSGLYRVKIADGTTTKVAKSGHASGLAWDHHGRLFLCEEFFSGDLYVIPRPGADPVKVTAGIGRRVGDIAFDPVGRRILVPDAKEGTITAIPAVVPGQEVDETPLPLETAVAFPDLQWTGWKGVTDKGTLVPLRPIVLTHAGDGSNRVFVATQYGVVHVFPNDQKATKTSVFLDIQDRVSYDDNQNEEGFLGLAFHPEYKKNGEFFVFYTIRKPKLTNVLCRYRVSKDDPNRADPASEEELLRITRPFWNHDGGTICFGPDGYLYVALGDGGSANDPLNNAQNLKTLLGKVLRIDINRKDPGKAYAAPKDNPFVDRKDAAPEIWAYGLRNIWRMAFDRKTGALWAGDVGQNLYEEINLIVKGGNYGWSLREGLHPFGPAGVGPRSDLVEPIWEYHHDTGKCIVGGHVYRGSRLPELDGSYLYADYTNGKLWALRHDKAKKRVVAHRPIKDRGMPILSFGEDEKGEAYLMTFTPSGKGIYWLVKKP